MLTRVEYLKLDKAKRFAVVDASMSELIRPALYNAWHDIVAVREGSSAPQAYDVVGPVCESSDVLGIDRLLAVEQGDLLAIMSAGAYAMAMASNYNSRPRPCEVMIDAGDGGSARARERRIALRARALPRGAMAKRNPQKNSRAGRISIASIPLSLESSQMLTLDLVRVHIRIGSPTSFDAKSKAW